MADKQITRRKFVRDSLAGAAGIAVGLIATERAAAEKPPVEAKKSLNYNPDMEYRRLGKTGLWVSAVAMGGHWKRVDKILSATGKTFDQNCHDIVSRCIDVGINYIDGTTDADLYVARTQLDAEMYSESFVELYCNDTAFWVRVEWDAGDSPSWAPEADNDFEIKIWDWVAANWTEKYSKTFTESECEGDGPQDYEKVLEVPSGTITEGGFHTIRATVRRLGTDDEEPSNSCTVELGKCTSGEKHVGATKNVPDVLGVKASIKTRWGGLCCDGVEYPEDSHTTAHVGLQGWWLEDGEQQHGWGEVGYLRSEELEGDFLFSELTWPGHHFEFLAGPSEETTHTYKVELEKSTGIWRFYYDGALFDTLSDWATDWQGKTLSNVYWQGEIDYLETDIPGTSMNRCNFTNCEYKKDGGDYEDPSLTTSDLFSDSISEWGCEWVDSNSFNIWDKNPGE